MQIKIMNELITRSDNVVRDAGIFAGMRDAKEAARIAKLKEAEEIGLVIVALEKAGFTVLSEAKDNKNALGKAAQKLSQ